MLKQRFLDNKPKILSLTTSAEPLLVFTDGSYEPGGYADVAMIGGVLLEGHRIARAFGFHVPKELLDRWHDDGKERLIGQVEMYAIAVAREIWKTRLLDRRVIQFVDN